MFYLKYKCNSIQVLWNKCNKQLPLYTSKIQIKNLQILYYQNKVIISQQKSILIASSVDLNSENDLFHRILSVTKISSISATKFQAEYIKYINKEKDDNYCNSLQWWHNYQNTYFNLVIIAFDLFAIFAMSLQCEQNFGKVNYIILI